jgi:chromosome segregation ATPase
MPNNVITTNKRKLRDVLADYRLVDKSVKFLFDRTTEAISKFDKLKENLPKQEEEFLAVCGEIEHILKKNQYESKKLEEIGDELREFGCKIPPKNA